MEYQEFPIIDIDLEELNTVIEYTGLSGIDDIVIDAVINSDNK